MRDWSDQDRRDRIDQARSQASRMFDSIGMELALDAFAYAAGVRAQKMGDQADRVMNGVYAVQKRVFGSADPASAHAPKEERP